MPQPQRQSTALAPALPTALPDRQALETELAHLKRRRGSAAIDGLPFDNTRLAEIESALVLQDDIEVVARERERGAAGDAEAERVARLREVIELADAERLQALADAEGAFSFVVEQLERVAALSEQIRVAGSQLQARPQLAFDPRVTEIRLSQYLVPGLVRLGTAGSFGDIEPHLAGGVMERAGQPWREVEAAVSGPGVALLLLAGPEPGVALRAGAP